jgi:gamma-glutamyltranspeptidase/glutathione hydrolase
VGDIIRNVDWANALKTCVAAERAAAGRGRIAGLEAARDAFYQGPIAERIVEFITTHPVMDATGEAHTGLLAYADLAEWHAEVETPVSYTYRGLEIHKCPTWNQGVVFLQQLALLAGYDLKALGHNSAEYLHLYIEAAKLAFADREAYYGDPKFDQIPLDVLLSPAYNAARRNLIEDMASRELRPGDIGHGSPAYATFDVLADNRHGLATKTLDRERVASAGMADVHSHLGDTTHLDAVDRAGNMVSATPSGGWLGTSPIIEGLGFPIGTRGQMFYLNAARPNALAGHKRPRATLTPSLATRDGQPYLVFGTPGGDGQDQWTVQFLLNVVEFGMNLQQAIDAPTVHSVHFPSSFYPRPAYPGRMVAENRVAPEVLAELERRGHEVERTGGWANGKVTAVQYDGERGVIMGAASPRRTLGYAFGW